MILPCRARPQARPTGIVSRQAWRLGKEPTCRCGPRSSTQSSHGFSSSGPPVSSWGLSRAYLNAVGGVADGVTFVVGSIFFTAASLGQLLQAQTPAMTSRDPSQRVNHRCGSGLWSWLPHDRNWVAAATQFPGTLFFNVSTTAALTHNMTAAEEDRRVWRPDLFGSTPVPRVKRGRDPRRLPRHPRRPEGTSAAADRLVEHARIRPLHGVRAGQLRTAPFRR